MASELYSDSPRFALAFEYAKKSCDKVYILSSKYRLISSLDRAATFKSSANWFGLKSPINEIANSGLWNVQGLNGNPLTQCEINYLKELVNGNLENYKEPKILEFKSTTVIKDDLSKISINPKEADNIKLKVSTAQIKNFISEIIAHAKETGAQYIDIVSGDIHKKMNLNNKMPSVCSAMYQLKKDSDEILHTTESGKSSTIKIRYYL